MKECTCCNQVKDNSEFSPQKRAPWKSYTWCNDCLAARPKPERKSNLYNKEMAEMRAKALQLRKFNEEQIIEIKAKHDAGMTVKELAETYNSCNQTIYRALKRYLTV